MKEITPNEIYDRLAEVEAKVDKLSKDTEHVVSAFTAASGAFTVLEWVAKTAKPILWIAGIISAFTFMLSEYKK